MPYPSAFSKKLKTDTFLEVCPRAKSLKRTKTLNVVKRNLSRQIDKGMKGRKN